MKSSNGTFRATRLVATTFGILVGLAGIDHGIFEILQGNVAPDGVMVSAIGPAQRFWEYGTEVALTLIPNFLISGILSVLIGLLVVVWSIAYIDRKYGAGILMLLSLALFLVGGGFAPIFTAILASLTATRMNRPLTFRSAGLAARVRDLLAPIWLGALIAFVVTFFVSVEIAIFGWPLTAFFDADTSFAILNLLAFIMLGLMLLSVLTGLAQDSRQRS
ncbi:MAG: hypothetical protein WD751_00740 [Anaerolineales bacterium]